MNDLTNYEKNISHKQTQYLSTVRIYCSWFSFWMARLETIDKQTMVHKRSH